MTKQQLREAISSIIKKTLNEEYGEGDLWREEFEEAIENLDLSPKVYSIVMKGLDHINPYTIYGDMSAEEAAKEYIKTMVDEFKSQMFENKPAEAPSKPKTEPAVHPGTKPPSKPSFNPGKDKDAIPKKVPAKAGATMKEAEMLKQVIKRFKSKK